MVGFYDLRRDGLRTYSWSVRELAAVERVQYLRGPAGILYGDGSPGGLVNLMLKKPLPVRQHELSVGGGELGFRRVTADSTGPLGGGRGVRYRLVAAAEGLEDGYDNDESRVSVLPMLSFDLGARTTLHLDGEYYDQRGRGYRHVVPATAATQAGDFGAIPWELNMASPDDAWRGWNASGGLRLDTQLSERASLHAAARYTWIDGDLDVQALAALFPTAAPRRASSTARRASGANTRPTSSRRSPWETAASATVLCSAWRRASAPSTARSARPRHRRWTSTSPSTGLGRRSPRSPPPAVISGASVCTCRTS
jgi:iron complex outermembrane receptor protein